MSTVSPTAADPNSGGSGGELYEAACRVREALRGRAALLIVDRTDIVDAAEADGVLLSPKGAETEDNTPARAAPCNWTSRRVYISNLYILDHSAPAAWCKVYKTVVGASVENVSDRL